uniref:Uncharacterized protein n=1 Tax=Arundo donax TaxID=35708 RepID=A0A0A9DPK5_ARUDO
MSSFMLVPMASFEALRQLHISWLHVLLFMKERVPSCGDTNNTCGSEITNERPPASDDNRPVFVGPSKLILLASKFVSFSDGSDNVPEGLSPASLFAGWSSQTTSAS